MPPRFRRKQQRRARSNSGKLSALVRPKPQRQTTFGASSRDDAQHLFLGKCFQPTKSITEFKYTPEANNRFGSSANGRTSPSFSFGARRRPATTGKIADIRRLKTKTNTRGRGRKKKLRSNPKRRTKDLPLSLDKYDWLKYEKKKTDDGPRDGHKLPRSREYSAPPSYVFSSSKRFTAKENRSLSPGPRYKLPSTVGSGTPKFSFPKSRERSPSTSSNEHFPGPGSYNLRLDSKFEDMMDMGLLGPESSVSDIDDPTRPKSPSISFGITSRDDDMLMYFPNTSHLQNEATQEGIPGPGRYSPHMSQEDAGLLDPSGPSFGGLGIERNPTRNPTSMRTSTSPVTCLVDAHPSFPSPPTAKFSLASREQCSRLYTPGSLNGSRSRASPGPMYSVSSRVDNLSTKRRGPSFSFGTSGRSSGVPRNSNFAPGEFKFASLYHRRFPCMTFSFFRSWGILSNSQTA